MRENLEKAVKEQVDLDIIQCTSNIMATLGHPQVATSYIQMATMSDLGGVRGLMGVQAHDVSYMSYNRGVSINLFNGSILQ